MENKFNEIITMLNNGIKHKEIVNEIGVSLDQVKKVSRLNNIYIKLENAGLDLNLLNVLKKLKYKALLLHKLFDNLDALKEILISIEHQDVITSNMLKEKAQLVLQTLNNDKKEYIKSQKGSIIENMLDYNKVRIKALNYLYSKGYVCTLDCILDDYCFDIISFNKDMVCGFDIILNNNKLLKYIHDNYLDFDAKELKKIYTWCNKFYLIIMDDNKEEIDELIKDISKFIGIIYIKYDEKEDEYKISKVIEDDIYQELDSTQLRDIQFKISRDLTEQNLKVQLNRVQRTNRIIQQGT